MTHMVYSKSALWAISGKCKKCVPNGALEVLRITEVKLANLPIQSCAYTACAPASLGR